MCSKSSHEFSQLFAEHDDPVRWEYPSGMDYRREIERFQAFFAQLQEHLAVALEYETEAHVQDASFHSQIRIGETWLRFSNFGGMVAFDDDDAINTQTRHSAMRLLQQNGYRFVPSVELQHRYTGRNPGITGIPDWYTRFFSWI
ncbi:MAG: hypothetical protein AAF790_02025 [Planctomycetota bacterium]